MNPKFIIFRILHLGFIFFILNLVFLFGGGGNGEFFGILGRRHRHSRNDIPKVHYLDHKLRVHYLHNEVVHGVHSNY